MKDHNPMKSIELTTLQREKLLNMATALFPELTFGFENDCGDLGILEYYTKDDTHKLSKKWTFIHWFEFCITYLAGRLTDGRTFYEFCDKCSAQKNLHMKWESELSDKLFMHPVDYLFEKFQKRTS